MQTPDSPSPPPPSSFSSSIPTFLTTFFNNLRDPKPKPIILYTFLPISLISLIFILSLSTSTSPAPHSGPDPFLYPTHQTHHRIIYDYNNKATPSPPSIAYLISGSRGDSGRVLRLLQASYHPLNQYLLHLDPSAPMADRENLALTVQSHPVFRAARNVHVMGKPDFAYPKGSSPVALSLHGAAILLRLNLKWDWFVSLSADAYPLITQDGMVW